MVSPSIKKDICHCFAQDILKFIFVEISDNVFALLVDESSDDACGVVKERFVGLVHVLTLSEI